jgi:sulfur relay (sulfurtransferase) DsrF/TusC family protein
MKVLSIVETAYRATAEEQDDTILWLNTMFKGADLDVSILLRGNAVNYLVNGQDASGLSFGGLELTHPPKIDEDIATLLDKGVPVHYVAEDLADRGIPADKLVDGVKPVHRAELPALLGQYDQVWHW